MVKQVWRYLLPVFFLALFFYPVLLLEVRTGKSDRILFSRKVSPGDHFEFHYIHSVDRTPVSGRFLITPTGTLQPIETQFRSYGPGLPSTEDRVMIKQGVIQARPVVEGMKRFSFLVSPFTHQQLVYKGSKTDFSTLREGETVRVEVRQYPMGGLIFKDGRK